MSVRSQARARILAVALGAAVGAGGARAAASPADAVVVPRAPDAVTPPHDRRAPTPAVPPPAGVVPPPPGPGTAAAATQECVDRALARRGLNAYGDPPGTTYPEGPPATGRARVERVLARYPELRTTCGVPPVR